MRHSTKTIDDQDLNRIRMTRRKQGKKSCFTLTRANILGARQGIVLRLFSNRMRIMAGVRSISYENVQIQNPQRIHGAPCLDFDAYDQPN